MVETAKEYIAAGDIFQVVLSQRVDVPTPAHPFTHLPRAADDQPVARTCSTSTSATTRSSARRRSCWCGSRTATSRITRSPAPGRAAPTPRRTTRAGRASCWPTRRSGPSTSCWSISGATTSAASPKPGTVRVPRLMEIERYSHVMHIVCNVEGEICDRTAARSTRCAPASRPGTVIGRAEDPGDGDHRRAGARPARAYAGAVGYFGFDGEHGYRASRCARWWSRTASPHVQAGGGIVADSTPDGEYEESFHKMRGAVLRAIELAERARAHELRDGGGRRMILLIDNYDSFTYNLYQYLSELGAEVHGRAQRRDHASTRSRRWRRSRRIVISPGPVHAGRGGHLGRR